MIKQIVEFQAKIYVDDLNSCAHQFGFEDDELWDVSLATTTEKSAIEKKFFPTISVKALPIMLLEIFRVVKTKLIRIKLHVKKKVSSNFQYMIAFSPKRRR
jgi:hypothetical protein